MGAAAGVQQNEISEFNVDLKSAPSVMTPPLPPTFKMRLSAECVDIIDRQTLKLICSIIYTDIESWVRSVGSFSLNLAPSVLQTEGQSCIAVTLPDIHAQILQKNILIKIQLLIDRMKHEGFPIKEFVTLKSTLLDSGKHLRSDWKTIIGQEKKLTAFQALEIYKHLNRESEFDRMDNICDLYLMLLNKSMFQLLINALETKEERENVMHRLNLHQDKFAEGAINISSRVLTSEIPADENPPT